MEWKDRVWGSKDIEALSDYLKSVSKGEEKAVWEQRIVNTALPCLAVPSTEIDAISKQISRGEIYKFLDAMPHDNLSLLYVSAKVLNHVKDIDRYIMYLDRYLAYCDCWGSTDVLKFPLASKYPAQFLALSDRYTRSDNPYVIRVGLLILHKGFVDEEHIDIIFDTLDRLKDNDHYYVMMMCAWILCECVVKVPDRSIAYIKDCILSKFVVNKAISKCHDSFRISDYNKALLKSYRRA